MRKPKIERAVYTPTGSTFIDKLGLPTSVQLAVKAVANERPIKKPKKGY